MALRKCKECSKQVSSKASACPNCGAPVKNAPTQYGCGSCLGILFLALVLLSITGLYVPKHSVTTKAIETPAQRFEREAKDQEIKATTEVIAVKTESFKKWALSNTAVTDISMNGSTMFVMLTPDKYTNRDNVRVIAETLARAYAIQVGLNFAVCHVFLGNEEYTKGSFSR